MSRWLAFGCILLALLRSCIAINCYQCQSNVDMHCAEKFDEKLSTVEPSSCDHIFEARYCIKTTGMYGGEIGTKRFCSNRDQGNYCEYIRRPGDEWEYRSCIYTCRTDGCNASHRTKAGAVTVVSAVLFAAIYLRL